MIAAKVKTLHTHKSTIEHNVKHIDTTNPITQEFLINALAVGTSQRTLDGRAGQGTSETFKLA